MCKKAIGATYLRSDVDFVLLVFLVASDQEGVGSGLLEQVKLHLAGETKSTPQCISLLGVKLAAIDWLKRGSQLIFCENLLLFMNMIDVLSNSNISPTEATHN